MNVVFINSIKGYVPSSLNDSSTEWSVKAFSSLADTNVVFTASYTWSGMINATHGTPTHWKQNKAKWNGMIIEQNGKGTM